MTRPATGTRCGTCGHKRRRAPLHVRRAWDLWNLDTLAWEAERETATRGHLGGSDENVWRETNPAPRFKTYMCAVYAEMRAEREQAERAELVQPTREMTAMTEDQATNLTPAELAAELAAERANTPSYRERMAVSTRDAFAAGRERDAERDRAELAAKRAERANAPSTDILGEPRPTLGYVAELAAEHLSAVARNDALAAEHPEVWRETLQGWQNLANLAAAVAELAGPETPRDAVSFTNANLSRLASEHNVDPANAGRVLLGRSS